MLKRKRNQTLALIAAITVLFGTVSNASAGAMLVDRSAMNTAYSKADVAVARDDERNWVVAAARAAWAVGTRVANTRAVQFAVGAVTGYVFGGSREADTVTNGDALFD
jgi:hypothetical protein